MTFARTRFTLRATFAAFFAAVIAQVACGSSATTSTAPSGLTKCAVTADATASTFPPNGGNATINVTTERECQWTASADGAWLKVMSGGSGQGPGTVQVAASANADPVTRTAAIVVNEQRVQVTQQAAECETELSKQAAAVSSGGGSGSVDVRTSSALCTWTAVSQAEWITITSGASGKGPGTVVFNAAPSAGLPRTGTIRIAGVSFSIDQSEGCSFAISPGTFAASNAGDSTAVAVTAGPGCPWSAASNASWISVSVPSGAGNGVVGITIAPSNGAARSGTATIAGQTFTVTQSQGCTYAIAPLSASAAGAGGSGRFDVAAGAGCPWSAASNASWLTVTAGASGSGNGAVQYSASPNTGPARSANVTVVDKTFTLTQEGTCAVSIAPSGQNVANGGASLSVAVTAAGGCPWTASSNASWITIGAGASGSGNGAVQLAVAANSGADRIGTVTIAGQAFTVTQGSGCAYSLSSSSQQIAAGGAPGSFTVTAGPGCSWAVSTAAPWISITSAASGSGTGTVQFNAAANTGPARSGTLGVAGQTFTVNQDSGCTASVTPDTLTSGIAGGSQTVQVTTTPACAWTAASGASWITFNGATSGTGSGSVAVAIAANAGPARTGNATIAGRTVNVSQDNGCTYDISPDRRDINEKGGRLNVDVTAGAGCPWTAKSEVSWIQVTRGATGAGGGTVQLEVDRNNGGSRTGTVTIAGRTFTVRQDN